MRRIEKYKNMEIANKRLLKEQSNSERYNEWATRRVQNWWAKMEDEGAKLNTKYVTQIIDLLKKSIVPTQPKSFPTDK